MKCTLCPRGCNVDRSAKTGYCKSPDEFKIARAALHFWEEPCISGKNGSGTVFFSGCNMRCVYCQNYEISHQLKGEIVSDNELVEIFENLISQGANNINLVNPTHYSHRLAEVLSRWKSPVPIVYNTSAYESVEALKRLDGLVDVYLPDMKYSRPDKAERYSAARDYFSVAAEAIAEMRRQVSDSFDENGMIQSGVIVRHLILPQNTNSSLEIIDWLCENIPDTYLSLMAQYVPCNDLSKCPEINRKITEREYNKVLDYALARGVEKIFVQERSSADKNYIPAFDFHK